MEAENGDERTSIAIFKHPDYEGWPSYYNDIAMIKLNKPAVFGKMIRPICLPEGICDANLDKTSSYVDKCDVLTIAGWGGFLNDCNTISINYLTLFIFIFFYLQQTNKAQF